MLRYLFAYLLFWKIFSSIPCPPFVLQQSHTEFVWCYANGAWTETIKLRIFVSHLVFIVFSMKNWINLKWLIDLMSLLLWWRVWTQPYVPKHFTLGCRRCANAIELLVEMEHSTCLARFSMKIPKILDEMPDFKLFRKLKIL